MKLPDAFLTAPIAHRGLHDRGNGVIENSPSAFERAIAGGYGIELDLQLSSDDRAMVFHDYDLKRLTGQSGTTRQHSAKALGQMSLTGSNDIIQDLSAILELVGGRVPLLIEIKDQDGKMGSDIGVLERATANALAAYKGPVALMSFNPYSVANLAYLCPDIPRGLVTSAYGDDWPLPSDLRDHLRKIPDYDRTCACFISHEAADLASPRVAKLQAQGAKILCWTIRSQAEAEEALKIADNITFEGFIPS